MNILRHTKSIWSKKRLFGNSWQREKTTGLSTSVRASAWTSSPGMKRAGSTSGIRTSSLWHGTERGWPDSEAKKTFGHRPGTRGPSFRASSKRHSTSSLPRSTPSRSRAWNSGRHPVSGGTNMGHVQALRPPQDPERGNFAYYSSRRTLACKTCRLLFHERDETWKNFAWRTLQSERSTETGLKDCVTRKTTLFPLWKNIFGRVWSRTSKQNHIGF